VARKRLVPSPGYGQALYDCIKHQRRADGSTWEAEDLSARLGGQGVRISGKQLREWIKRGNAKLAVAVAIAKLFDTTVDEMWAGHCRPINPNLGVTPHSPVVSGPAGDQAQSVARSRAQAAKAARRTPGHRRSG
jgi:hypothetical protein